MAEGVVDDISHEGLRALLREEGVTFQRLKTWKASKDPRYAAKKARIEHLYAIADGEAARGTGDPAVVFCLDESGPLNLQPRPGRQWAALSGKGKEPGRRPRPRMRHLQPHWRDPAPVRRLRAGQGQALRAHQAAQDPDPGPGVLPVPALPLPTRDQDRDRLRQLQPAPDHRQRQPGRRMGRSEQHRDRLHPGQFVLVKPDRSSIHRAAVLHPRRHRPRQPPATGQHDPPVHQLAQQPRPR